MNLILIVGVGGIGSNLFQKLARYAPLNYHICLIDGDTVEPKNIERQCFTQADIGKNKAECLSHKANNQIGQRFSYYPYYLDTNPVGENQLHKVIGQDSNESRHYSEIRNLIIFGCVDNHPTRKMLEFFAAHSNADRVFYVDGANDEYTGDVVSILKSNDGIKGSFRSSYDYNVMVDKSNDPNNSCQNELLDGNIQTLIANDKVAVIMLEVFNNFLNRKECVGLWKFKSCLMEKK